MSFMEIYAVKPDGNVEQYGEAHNSFGGAMHIWMKLSEKYHIPIRFLSETGFNELWASIGQMEVPDRWVMASTFDRFIIPEEHLPMLIEYWKLFTEHYPTSTLREGIAILESASQDKEVVGVCFNHSSGVDLWSIPIEDEDDGSRPYNVNTDTGHKFLTPEYVKSRGKGN